MSNLVTRSIKGYPKVKQDPKERRFVQLMLQPFRALRNYLVPFENEQPTDT